MKRPTWDIPIDKEIEFSSSFPNNRFISRRPVQCAKKYEIVDSDKMTLRKGDIIIFRGDVPGKYPRYAIGEYGVILERYRITKYKGLGEYKDYGVVVMMISGKKKGHIFKMSSMKIGNSEKLLL